MVHRAEFAPFAFRCGVSGGQGGWGRRSRLFARRPGAASAAASRGGWRRGATMALGLALTAGLFAGPELIEQPLAPRSGPRGKTMFAEIPPAVSGVVTTNDYADPAMWGDRYREFEVGSIGTGVAIGDYDGDGRPDIFVVSKTESCRLFRNLGDFRFEDVTEKAGVGDQGAAARIWKNGAAFVDVNNDGRLDIYVCRFNAPNLLYINQGDGTFRECAHAYGLDLTDASVMAAFADYDRDGWLDVLVQTNLLDPGGHPQGQRNHLFHNNGNGTFTEVTDRAGITGEGQGHAAIWWDYDNDGWPDLYVGNDFATPDKLYHNNRDGTFTNVLDRVVPHTPFSSMGADLGDVNNDGRIDLLVADMATTTREADQRGMADSRGRTVDDQGDPAAAPQYERNALYLATGTGRCLEAAELAGVAATDWTWAPRLADLDNDGRLDLFVTNGMYRESTNLDLLGRQMAAESMVERMRVMRNSPVLAERNIARRNLGDLRFADVGSEWGLDQRGVSFGAAFGDLDGDGDLDLVFANYGKGVTLLRNDCESGHRVMVALRGTTSNRYGIGAVVRIESASGEQVRSLVLARGYMSTDEPIAHFGLGGDALLRRLSVEWPSGRTQTFHDLAVDRRYTITEPAGGGAAADETRASAALYEEAAAGMGVSASTREALIDDTALQPLIPVRLNRRGPALAFGTLGVGRPNALVIGGTTETPLQILIQAPDGKFAPGTAALPRRAMPVDDGPVLLFDANGDGVTDLLVTKGGAALPAGAPAYRPVLWYGDGSGGFHPAPDDAVPALPIDAGAAAAADFNHDGALDVFVGGRVAPGQYPTAPASALWMNQRGRFVDVTDTLAPGLRHVGMVTSALWSDVDGDGWVDLLITVEWGRVRYFHNNHGAGFEDRTEQAGFGAAGTGWWTSLAAGDFNGDGRLDYVVGNAGLNTPYRADSAHPAVLFSGDFTGDGDESQLVEAAYEGNRLLPVRSRRALGAAIPSLLRRYPRNNNFAAATIEEIIGPDRMARAQRWAATELRSGIFLSQADGTFRFEPLPRIAQIAPLDGIAVADFDGDGHLDLYAAENSFAPIPSVGRYDGGLGQLLLGDGHGRFTPLPPAQSGLVVSGDAKAVVLAGVDAAGWPECVVSRNNEATMAFRHRSAASGRAFAVRLAGPPGNPTTVGARITVEYIDGSVVAGEISAGSSLYSQSDAACHFGAAATNPPTGISVRWPDGRCTRQKLSECPVGVVVLRETPASSTSDPINPNDRGSSFSPPETRLP